MKSVEFSISQSSIRDIWQRFVDIQEKLIKQRCSPISIVSDSIEVDNDKLYVTFLEPVRAATPGQALVVYDGENVALGGTIIKGMDENE